MIAITAAMMMMAAEPTAPTDQAECQKYVDIASAQIPSQTADYKAQINYSAHYVAATGSCYAVMQVQILIGGAVADHGTLVYKFGSADTVAELHWAGDKLDACKVADQTCTNEAQFNDLLQKLLDGA